MNKDKELIGNETIEKSIEMFLLNRCDETLAALLTSVRKQMLAEASFVVAVEPNIASGMELKQVTLKDGRSCGMVFTSFDQEMAGTNTVSTFMVNMKQLFEAVLANSEIDGVLVNAYGKAFLLDKVFIKIILGE
ncbi:MAG: SseB family protein [Lachnospiraceae bacterium]|nr:SseB family protein [Lachnospiraceae bacterium]